MFRDKEAISSKRPRRFVEAEKEDVRRNSSIVQGDVDALREARRASIAEKNEGVKGGWGDGEDGDEYREGV